MTKRPQHGDAFPPSRAAGHLLLIGCSATKRDDKGLLPAIERYDGVNFKVLRKFLLENGWPAGLVIKILSAKYGLIDVTSLIEHYDERMTPDRALCHREGVTAVLESLGPFQATFVNLGKDYLPALDGDGLSGLTRKLLSAKGGIGMKMRAMKKWLRKLPNTTATMPRTSGKRPYLYFFPDWDDYVSVPFTGEDGTSTGTVRKYAHEIFGSKQTPYDGMLVSLAQLYTGKGALSRLDQRDVEKANLRKSMKVPTRLLLFGDCGAFSYVNEDQPPFTSAEAARLYDHFGFDIGASVDHIPLPEIQVADQNGNVTTRVLSRHELKKRVSLTCSNAEKFLQAWRRNHYRFVPLGVIQGTSLSSYVECAHRYLDMGYKHIALGGLVPRSDQAILDICCAVREAIQSRTRTMRKNVWPHPPGILRPKIQPAFRVLGVSSFDSASYLRKAWLRSDQNYLAPDGKTWYSTIRIPISQSSRMQDGARIGSITPEQLVKLEQQCLRDVRGFDGTSASKSKAVKAINAYGPILERRGEDNHFIEKHNVVLLERPWRKCRCPMCQELGIDIVIFRGAARNKRRGLHNTWVFYHQILHG
jgi:hypothetical protein